MRLIQLEQFIQQEHLFEPLNRKSDKVLRCPSIGLIQMDDFLRPEIVSRCAEFLKHEANYEAVFGCYSGDTTFTSESHWEAQSERDRFFCYQIMASANSHPFSPNAIAFLKFRHFLGSSDFKQFIEKLFELKLGKATPVEVHRMATGHFLKSHNDRNDNRKLAFIFYLSPDWQDEYGGSLEVVNGVNNRFSIEPTFNRLVVFDVEKHDYHWIADVDEPSNHSTRNGRISINGWFYNSAS